MVKATGKLISLVIGKTEFEHLKDLASLQGVSRSAMVRNLISAKYQELEKEIKKQKAIH